MKSDEIEMSGRTARSLRFFCLNSIAEIDGIDRIRFTTSHPLEFSDSLIEAYRDVPQLANYLQLPVQSGSDRILAAMQLVSTALEFQQKLRQLHAAGTVITLSSAFTVAITDETDLHINKHCTHE